jgi:hypothetical protein
MTLSIFRLKYHSLINCGVQQEKVRNCCFDLFDYSCACSRAMRLNIFKINFYFKSSTYFTSVDLENGKKGFHYL